MKKITGIMACDPDGVIALNNKLPWHYPQEIEFYRQSIANHCVILGYKTFIEMTAEFTEHHYTVVFTSKPQQSRQQNVHYVSGLEEFKKLRLPTDKKCFMIGGAQLAKYFLQHNLLDDFILTIINNRYAGDTFFPLELITNWPRKLLQQNADFAIYHYFNPTSELPPQVDGI